MKKSSLFTSVLFFLCMLQLTLAQAQVKQGSVKVHGEVLTTLNLTLTDLEQYPQIMLSRTDRDGKQHTYSGVVLAGILGKAGVTLGKNLRGENLTKFVLISARDSYQVIFALAELDKDFTDRKVILADKMDGHWLPDGDGPFRVIVQDEKKPARCIKEVTDIDIEFAK